MSLSRDAIYLNESGRRKYLGAFVRRMEETVQVGAEQQPRWDGLMQQVKAYKQFVYDPTKGFQPYRIR